MQVDIAYAEGREVALDVIPPMGESKRTAVLVFHGGAWRFGARQMVWERSGELAARGFTAITVGYRLLDAAAWPAQLEDVAAALDWVRAHADELGVDADKIVVQGHSAGAHLALLAGALPAGQRPAAVVAYYPAIGFFRADPPDPTAPPGVPPMGPDFRAPHWMLLDFAADDDAIRSASPLDQISADFPPTFLLHGLADIAIPHRSSISLHEALTELGVPAELHLYADRNHEFDMAPAMAANASAAVASFLDRHVVDTAGAAAEIAQYPFPPAMPE